MAQLRWACLEPHQQRYAGMGQGYIIELKYLKRSGPAGAARVAKAGQQASAQVQRYVAAGRLARQYPSVRGTGLALVFYGWELAHAEAVSVRQQPESSGASCPWRRSQG